jgi:hypothetical protein
MTTTTGFGSVMALAAVSVAHFFGVHHDGAIFRLV